MSTTQFLVTSITVTSSQSVTTEFYNLTTTKEPDDAKLGPKEKTLNFIIAPICIFSIICFIAAMIFLFLRKKRLDRLRHRLMPLYNFDPGEEGEDWEAELLEDANDFNNRRGYKSIDHPEIQQTKLSFE
uniref:Uncharacterized protein n=1 Tax=Clastoptera arizonana TaxID=38151 RepID=A0A1B6E349_9HEMI